MVTELSPFLILDDNNVNNNKLFFFFFDVKGSSQENVTPRNPYKGHTSTFYTFDLSIVKNSRQLFAIFRCRQKNQTESDHN
jgi:hypothetical protein